MDKQLKLKQLKQLKATNLHPTPLKLTTQSTYSTKSFPIYPAYLSTKLLSINYSFTPKVSITDWEEAKDKIVLRKVNQNTFLLEVANDCYSQSYSNLEEAVFDMITYVETNILPQTKGTSQ